MAARLRNSRATASIRARTSFCLLASVALGGCASTDSADDGAALSSVTASESAGPSGSAGNPSGTAPGGASSTSSSESGTPSPSGGSPVGGATTGNGGQASPSGGPSPSTPGGGLPSPSGGTGGNSAGGSSGGGENGAAGSSENSAGAGGRGGANVGDPPSAGGSPGSAGAGGSVSIDEPIDFPTCPDTTWKLVWGDDFDGPEGAAVDGSKWAYDSGPNWYNGELQDYTTGADNAFLDGSGNLVIEARREAREGRDYTSARLKTEGKHTFTYGRFEGRMKLPFGQGMWPAFWMLGGNSWPADGEIDIMENLGREPSIAHGTIHGPGYSGADGPGTAYTLPGGAVFSDDFHIFAIEWEPNEIRWYVDGEHYSTKTPSDIGGNRWVFDHPFFFIVNLAVGGEWPGNPDETTQFPQRLLVDYIRVCEQ